MFTNENECNKISKTKKRHLPNDQVLKDRLLLKRTMKTLHDYERKR